MQLVTARRASLLIWIIGSAVPSAILFLQTVADRYGGRSEEAWSWLVPSVVPTLGLMIGVAMKPSRQRAVDPFAVRLAAGLSITYLLLILATLAVQPFSALLPLQLLQMSHLWLAPVQGLVAGSIGFLFARQAG
jgi:hypothetical protein